MSHQGSPNSSSQAISSNIDTLVVIASTYIFQGNTIQFIAVLTNSTIVIFSYCFIFIVYPFIQSFISLGIRDRVNVFKVKLNLDSMRESPEQKLFRN